MNSSKAPVYQFEYYLWSLKNEDLASYKVRLRYEKWELNKTGDSVSFNITSSVTLTSTILEKVYSKGPMMEIFDRFAVTMVDKDDPNFLWLMIEHTSMDNYILRFSKKLLQTPSSDGILKTPDVWRVDNPIYGFIDNGFEIKSQKSDWLLASIKMIRDISYLIIYIIPDEFFVNTPQSISSIYTKEITTFDDVIDFTIEKSFAEDSRIL